MRSDMHARQISMFMNKSTCCKSMDVNVVLLHPVSYSRIFPKLGTIYWTFKEIDIIDINSIKKIHCIENSCGSPTVKKTFVINIVCLDITRTYTPKL